MAEGDPAEVVAIHKEHSRRAKAEREAAIAAALDGVRRRGAAAGRGREQAARLAPSRGRIALGSAR